MRNTDTQKAALRADLKARRAAIPDHVRAQLERALCDNLLALPALSRARLLLLYAPLPHEINILPLFSYARERNIPCAFPRCTDKTGEMTFHLVRDLSELAVGKYGIREPREDAPPIMDFDGALLLAPALAFDRQGFRLGYGGGYYDRFLAARPISSVGVTFDDFLLPALPHSPLDIAVDTVVTEKKG